MILLIIGIIIAVVVIYIIVTYNSLVNFQNRVKDSWAGIDVLLKRRNDLIPNLIETVKGYAEHEKTTLDAVVSARNAAVNANGQKEEIETANALTSALGNLFAVAENYPELKANENFMNLQNNLKDTEDKISFARHNYNDMVLLYKNKLEMFPSNIIANMFNFKSEEFFTAQEEEKELPKVNF